jgi:amino acid transporter
MTPDTKTSAPTELRRDMGLAALVLFGIAYLGPVGVYATYGELDRISQGTPSGAYVIGLAVMVVTASSYGRMAALYPAAGSAYTYTRRSIHPSVGFLVGWAAILDYVLLPWSSG